jgi:probable rRNA maturation factor
MIVEINNLTKFAVDNSLLKGVAKKVIKEENRRIEELSIVLVGEKEIRDLNKKYRGIDKSTDVLSFGEGVNEVVICPEIVEENAKIHNTSFKKEIIKMLIHSILHILGYIHGKIMENKEEKYLNTWQNHI